MVYESWESKRSWGSKQSLEENTDGFNFCLAERLGEGFKHPILCKTTTNLLRPVESTGLFKKDFGLSHFPLLPRPCVEEPPHKKAAGVLKKYGVTQAGDCFGAFLVFFDFGAFLVFFGAFLVLFWCFPGVFWCFPGAFLVLFWCFLVLFWCFLVLFWCFLVLSWCFSGVFLAEILAFQVEMSLGDTFCVLFAWKVTIFLDYRLIYLLGLFMCLFAFRFFDFPIRFV